MLSSLGHDYNLLDDDSQFSPQPDGHQRIESTSSSAVARLPLKRDSYTPYSNGPTSRLIPRKRYIILRPDVQRNRVTGISTVRRLVDATIPPKTMIRTVTVPSTSIRRNPLPVSSTVSSTMRAPMKNTQYVLKIPVIRNENRSLKRNIVVDPKPEPFTYPTVPASMSMGGEYIVEEEVEEDVGGGIGWNREVIDNTSLFDIKPEPQYLCSELDCFWRGDSDAALRRHVHSTHVRKLQVVVGDKKINTTTKAVGKPKGVRCSECENMAYSRPLLLKHMNHAHGIEAPIMHRTFDDREELQSWLEELRTTHAVEFVVSSGSKKWGFGLQVHYLTCSRSGEQKERPNKKFARPPRPSIKCGKNCMAYLKIKQNPVTSTLQVEGCLFHSGHMIDGQLISLTQQEWRKIEAVAEQSEKDLLYWNPENMGAVRDVLGHYGRFRLIPDNQLSTLLYEWIDQYKSGAKRSNSYVPSYVSPSASVVVPKYKFPVDLGGIDLLQPNMMLDDFEHEYDSNSPASPLPSD